MTTDSNRAVNTVAAAEDIDVALRPRQFHRKVRS
jgi:hypothetical protein